MNNLDNIDNKVLENILLLINKRNLSDVDFCNKIGLGVKTVDNWKRGVSKSYMKKLPQLASFFNISIDYLLGNIDEKEEYNRKLNKLGEDYADSEEVQNRFLDKEIHPSANETDECKSVLVDEQTEALIKFFDELCQEDRQTLVEHARFLTSRQKKSID